MSEQLWYIYDFENCLCDECGKEAACAIWRQFDTGNFVSVCGVCDQPWRDKRILTNGD